MAQILQVMGHVPDSLDLINDEENEEERVEETFVDSLPTASLDQRRSPQQPSHNISEIDYTHFSWSSSTAASRSTQTAGENCSNSNSTLIEFSETETEKIKQYGPGFNIMRNMSDS